jgi:hypothetical protein
MSDHHVMISPLLELNVLPGGVGQNAGVGSR